MYIPITFFGSQGSCFTTTTSTIAGDGIITTGSFVSGGFVWDYYQFEMSDREDVNLTAFTASLNVLTGSTAQAKVLVVGAGGSGGFGAGGGGSLTQEFGVGGGGGGGIVYYNQFPLSSGSYEIGVAKAVSTNATYQVGTTGGRSYFKNKDFAYTPFTSSVLTAYGGGGGGWGQLDSVFPITCILNYGSGSSTTGGIGLYTSQCGARSALNTLYSNLGGIDGGPQGYKGGDIQSTTSGITPGSGGGGAGAIAPTLTTSQMSGGTYGGNGGDGLDFNLTGTIIGVSPGAGGQGGSGATTTSGNFGNCTNNTTAYGRGGRGERDGTGTSINFGLGGLVIVAIPRCESAFSCRQFAITGSGAVASFLECGNSATSSTTLASGFDIVACLKTYSGSITPVVATGATYVALSASCETAFTSSNSGCTNCNTYAVTSDTNKISKVTYTPCNESTSSVTYIAGTFNLCVSGSGISVATGSASSLETGCSVIGCDTTPSNTNTPPCPCQFLFVNVFSGRYDFDYTDCNGVTQRGSSSSFSFCGVPGSIRNGSCAVGSCVGLSIRQGGDCCTYP